MASLVTNTISGAGQRIAEMNFCYIFRENCVHSMVQNAHRNSSIHLDKTALLSNCLAFILYIGYWIFCTTFPIVLEYCGSMLCYIFHILKTTFPKMHCMHWENKSGRLLLYVGASYPKPDRDELDGANQMLGFRSIRIQPHPQICAQWIHSMVARCRSRAA